ncbi:SDR family oxidoreductase [Bacteroidota bacterium]
MKFKDKVIWITGAASGIGEALAYQSVKYGAKLILSDIDEARLKEVAVKCEEMNAEVLMIPLDLSSRESVENSVPIALSHFNRVDVLINNGGISQRALTWETSLEVDYRIMSINFFGAVILTKALLPSMMEHGDGYIAVTSSINGKFGFPLRSAYSASKHAVLGFFETLGIELSGTNISVTVAMPGRVQTNISYHSLTKDGTPHGVMDPGLAAGIPADVCAKKYMNAIYNRRREVLIGRKELLLVHIRRFFPRIFFILARKLKTK